MNNLRNKSKFRKHAYLMYNTLRIFFFFFKYKNRKETYDSKQNHLWISYIFCILFVILEGFFPYSFI